jgi:hypothetical protein
MFLNDVVLLSNDHIAMPTIIKTTTGASTMILDCHASTNTNTSTMRQRRFPFLFALTLLCSFRVDSVLGTLAPTTSITRSALSLRGGTLFLYESNPNYVEVNPNWVPPGPNPHHVWLGTQQTYNNQDQSSVTYENVGSRPQSPLARDRLVNYASQLHQSSPSLSISALACIVVFVLWQ